MPGRYHYEGMANKPKTPTNSPHPLRTLRQGRQKNLIFYLKSMARKTGVRAKKPLSRERTALARMGYRAVLCLAGL